MIKESAPEMIQKKIIQHIADMIDAVIADRGLVRVTTSKSSEFYHLIKAVNCLADHYRAAKETIHMLNQQLKKNNLNAIMALIEALEAKDPYTRNHSERVPIYSLLISEKLNLSSEEIDSIYIASYLHDVGKIGVCETILNKPGRLTAEEYEEVKNHPCISSQIVSQIPNLSHIAGIIRHHHERFDGSGYPDGLRGDNIPLGAKVIAIADAFDAMTSSRPYRSAFEPREALLEIERGAGSQFDPIMADTFIEAYREVYGEGVPNINAPIPFPMVADSNAAIDITNSRMNTNRMISGLT